MLWKRSLKSSLEGGRENTIGLRFPVDFGKEKGNNMRSRQTAAVIAIHKEEGWIIESFFTLFCFAAFFIPAQDFNS